MVKRSRRLLALLRQNLSPRARSIRPHHYLHFELVPGYRSPDGAATHNSYGFRGKEFTIKKPVGAKRVVCIGESTTYCTGIKDAQTWPERLSEKLGAEVINAGVPA
jgi:hypothetical protein